MPLTNDDIDVELQGAAYRYELIDITMKLLQIKKCRSRRMTKCGPIYSTILSAFSALSLARWLSVNALLKLFPHGIACLRKGSH